MNNTITIKQGKENWEGINPKHLEEMNSFAVTPITRIIYAMSLLSDVMDKDMIGEERNEHINDVKIIIKNYLLCSETPVRDYKFNCSQEKQVIIKELEKKIRNLESFRDKLTHEIIPLRKFFKNTINNQSKGLEFP